MDFDEVVNGSKQFFRAGKTSDLAWRENQLRAILAMLEENRDRINNVLQNDLNKTDYEIEVFEIMPLVNEISVAINNMGYWVKPEYVPGDMRYFFVNSYF